MALKTTILMLNTINTQEFAEYGVFKPILGGSTSVWGVLGSNEKMIFSKKCQKRVQEGRITHREHYKDLLRVPTSKTSTWTIFDGGKKNVPYCIQIIWNLCIKGKLYIIHN